MGPQTIARGRRRIDTQSSVQIPFTDLPEGTVTFLFTDIEGSTQLLHRLKDKYAILLADHHRILRETFASWNGYEVDTQGDAFFVAFTRATQAVGAAVEAQRKLIEHIWPERVAVKVRMGIHTGESWTGSEGYVGMEVHRAARIAHVGNGGQVLLSETSTALVRDELPPGVSLLDLGRHLLKDINRPERINQLVIEGIQSEFPPLTSLEMLPPESARSPRKVGVCPYRGLAAFQEADAKFYFGRETFIDALERAVSTRKLVAVVVGSSGSGKSSAIFAGLIPRLRKAGGYQFATFRPGPQPFYALAGAIVPLLERGLSKTDLLTETRKLAERMAKGEVSLAQVIGRIQEDSPETQKVLLVVDQLEELYTLCQDAKLQNAFVDDLLETVETSKARRDTFSIIVLTMRADFMGQALAHRTFADAMQEASLLMGPMSRQELHTTIEKPAEMQGAAFEPGLVERILDDVGEKPGNLPLLEFTLTQLWEQQTDGWLTHADYEAMGCVEGALAVYADQVYRSMESDEKELTRRAMVQLVQPGEGTEDTRRIATREELGEESWRLSQQLANKRLVVTGRDAQGRDTIEVVHEALIQKWGLFREWMDIDRDFRAWQERLRGSMRQWHESGNDKGSLLAGVSLAVSQGWLAERSRDLGRAEMEYIAASQVEQRTLQEAEIAREKREIALTRRSRNFLYALVVILLLAVIGASGLTYLARQAQGEAEHQSMARATQQVLAEQQADLARARELALAALNNLYTDPERSILLGLQSVSIYTSLGQPLPNDLQSNLHLAIQASRVRMTWEAGANSILSAGFIQPGDQPYVLTYDNVNNVVSLWDPIKDQNRLEVPVTPSNRMIASLNRDGTKLAISENDTIRFIDIQTGQEQKRLSGYPVEITGLTFSPDSQLMLSIGKTSFMLREIESGIIRLEIRSPEGDRLVAAFSPDGKLLAIRTSVDTVSIFDTLTRDLVSTIQLSTDMDVIDLSFNPDGTHLAGAGRVTQFPIWNVQTGELLLSIDAIHGTVSGGGQIETLAYSPDGKWLALPGVIYDASTGEDLFFLPGHKTALFNLAFNSDGTRLITASYDNTVKMWDLTPSREVLTLSHPSGGFIYGVAFSPDGNWLVTTGADKTARVWELKTGRLTQILEGHTDFVNSVAFSPDGSLIATGSADLSVRIWETKSWRTLRVLTEHLSDLPGIVPVIRGVVAVAFNPQCEGLSSTGKNCPIAGVGMDGQLIVWDALTGRILYTYQDPDGGLKSVAFSEDGKLLTVGSTGVLSSPIGAVKIFDASNGEIIHTYPGKSRAWAWGVAFNPDGNRLATINYFGEVNIWDLETNELQLSVTQTGSGNSIAFDPTGSFLATAGSGSLTVRDAQTGEQLFDLIGHNAFPIYSLAFSQDGKYLATGAFDGTARVYVIPPDDLLDFARSRLTRSLTSEECQQYLHMEKCPTVP